MTHEVNTLITSGAYIGEEMQAEFGRIPPAFLPVGSAYLVQHQLRHLHNRKRKWITLPADFELNQSQQRLLTNDAVGIVRVDPNKSLGMSVFHAALEIDPDWPLEILHGDTLLRTSPPNAGDLVSVEAAAEQYKWGLVETNGDRVTGVRDAGGYDSLTEDTLILSGYFVFQSTWVFLKCLMSADFSFTGAIDNYCAEKELRVDRELESLDCGHLKTFYNSRQQLAAARHFNSVGIDAYVVRKQSRDARKIDAEAHWLRSMPADLQPFTARLVEDESSRTTGEYSTLYSNYPTVAELYLAQSSRLVWRKIIDSCRDYLGRAYQHQAPDGVSPLHWLVIEKLRKRICDYPAFLPAPDQPLTINGVAIGSLNSIVGRLEQIIESAPAHRPCIMHGDFCFSNMLFDLRSDRIILIDPRGLIGEETTVYGDIRYDIAKLGHSIVGRYDQIVGEHLVAQFNGDGGFILSVPEDSLRQWLEQQFLTASITNVSFEEKAVAATIVSLFLAMIPLHAESAMRQQTLFSNALRLYDHFFPHKIN